VTLVRTNSPGREWSGRTWVSAAKVQHSAWLMCAKQRRSAARRRRCPPFEAESRPAAYGSQVLEVAGVSEIVDNQQRLIREHASPTDNKVEPMNPAPPVTKNHSRLRTYPTRRFLAANVCVPIDARLWLIVARHANR